jgi:hypothetical protein
VRDELDAAALTAADEHAVEMRVALVAVHGPAGGG